MAACVEFSGLPSDKLVSRVDGIVDNCVHDDWEAVAEEFDSPCRKHRIPFGLQVLILQSTADAAAAGSFISE
jgi:hypothetical protein